MITPAISLVMVLYGKRRFTELALESLSGVLGPKLGVEIELVLVDNASPDDTGELLDAWADRATLVRNAQNRNFAGGSNDGAKAAGGEILVFLNNDMEFLPGTIETVAATAAEPDVGAAGARLLFPDGTLQHAGIVWEAGATGLAMPVHAFHHEAGDLAAALVSVDLDAVTGACLAIRRELFLDVGGFDESYVNGLEDIDLCLKIRSRGLRIVYRGDVAAVHHESVTRGVDNAVSAHNDHIFQTRWAQVTGSDDELVSELYGGRLPPAGQVKLTYPERNDGGDISVEGHLRSLAPEAAETRAILLTLESNGFAPCAREWIPTRVEAELSISESEHIRLATLHRLRSPRALRIETPTGSLFDVRRRHGDILRLAVAPDEPRHLDGVTAVWAASNGLVGKLLDLGMDESRVWYLPPPIPPVQLGRGTGGLLVLLPGHDPGVCADAMDQLADLQDTRIRLLPNVLHRELPETARHRLGSSELLAPITSEIRFGELAATADAVLCLDDSDVFGRRALVAAGAGAAVTTRCEAALEVLAELVEPLDGRDLVSMARSLLSDTHKREARHRRVAERCAPSALAQVLEMLVESARAVDTNVLARL